MFFEVLTLWWSELNNIFSAMMLCNVNPKESGKKDEEVQKGIEPHIFDEIHFRAVISHI